MLIRIFKITTSLTLLSVLVFLVVNRDISIPFQKDKKEDRVINSEELPPTETESTSSLSLTHKESTSIYPTTPSSETLSHTQVTVSTSSYIIQKNSQEKVDTYLQEHLGTSDTDESYKPSISPCAKPMGYTIGTFDTRFGISKSLFLQEIKQASETWGDASGKTLFYYDESGPLTINLIYDSRQARTQDINYLALEIDNSKKTADQIKQYYEEEKILYDRESVQLTDDAESFQLRYKAYMNKVTLYNSQGGAQKGEYDAMTSELESLKSEAKALEARKESIAITAESLNKKVAKYNNFITYINGLISQSNALGGKKFTEGRFAPGTNTIDIYQYTDSTKLRRVITHELGHVLGINHNTNMYSIMYSVNSATTTILSKEDLRDLRIVCPQ